MIPLSEYNAMEFNPTIHKQLVEVYPKLRTIVGEVDDKMLRYVILMYDMKSPVKDHYPDLPERKKQAAVIAGLDPANKKTQWLFEFKCERPGVDSAGVKCMVEAPYDEFLKVITSYLRYQNNYMWSMMVSNEQAFFEFGERVMVPVGDGKDKDILQAVDIKKKLMEAQDDIVQRLKKYMRELSGDDVKLEEAISKRKRLRPENVSAIR